MSDSVGRVDLDLGLNYKQFNNQLNGISGTATSRVGGAFKKLGFIIAGAFAVKEMVNFGGKAIGLASDLNEVQNVVDVTFGSMAEHVNNFSKSALTSFGLSELSAKKFTSTMGAMLKSSGLAGKDMLVMSESLTGLSADFASFYNLNNQDAFDKVRAGIAGETEPLRQLGINMTVANLEAFALTQGIKKQYQAMSQAEQVLLRYNYLMNVSKDAQGDFARTSNGWANQTRVLSEQWKIFQGTMGQGFINILTPVLQMLNSLIAKLQVAAQYFKAFTALITGVNQATGGAASSTETLGSEVGDTSKAVKKAGKEVKGSLSGFDQLNVISQSTADAMGDITGGAEGMAGMGVDPTAKAATPEIDMSQFQPLLDILGQIKAVSSEVGSFLYNAFGPSVKTLINDLIPPLLSWKTTLSETFSGIAALGAPFKAWFSADLIPFLQQYIVTGGEIFAGFLDSANMVFTGIRDAAMPVLTWFVTDGLPLLTDFATGALQVYKSLFDNTKIIFDKVWSEGVQPGLMLLSSMTVDTLDILKGFWDTFGTDIVGGLTGALDSIRILFVTLWDSFLGPIWNNMLTMMSWLWDKHLKGLIEQITIFVGKLVTAALDIFNKFIIPVVNYLVERLGPTFSNAFSFIGDVLGTFLAVAIDIVAAVIKSLGGIIDFIAGVFTGDWERAWTGIKDFFGGIFDGVVAVFKGSINLIIDGLNFLIRQLNTIKVDIPDWVPKIGGKKFGINIPQIPKLAEGGLIGAPTLAMVGDNKNAAVDPEVVSPLSKLKDMMAYSNQAVVEVLVMILDAIERQEMSLEIDGEKLTRYLRNTLRLEGSRVGKNAVTVGGVSLR